MISPHHPLASAILRALSRNPGATVAELAAMVRPAPPLAGPLLSPRTREGVEAYRRLLGAAGAPARGRRPAVAAVPGERQRHEAEARRQVARVLSRLTEAGYVEPVGAAHVADWFHDACWRRGFADALNLAFDRMASCGAPALTDAEVRACRRELVEVVMRPGWSRVRSGGRAMVRARLSAAGVVVTPGQRRLTEAGMAAVGAE